jgi:hypothetical protein
VIGAFDDFSDVVTSHTTQLRSMATVVDSPEGSGVEAFMAAPCEMLADPVCLIRLTPLRHWSHFRLLDKRKLC